MSFKTTIEVEVKVVGRYTGETHATFEEPGESAHYEVESVLMQVEGRTLDILPVLTQMQVEELEELGRDNAEEDAADYAIAQAEARADAKEDR